MRSKRQPRQLGVVRCHICTSIVPITFDQQHHVVPQAAGGTDGQTVQLCSGCHHNLHRLADMMVGGRAGLAEDSAEIAYPDARIRARAFALAKTAAEYMVLKRDGLDGQLAQHLQVGVEMTRYVRPCTDLRTGKTYRLMVIDQGGAYEPRVLKPNGDVKVGTPVPDMKQAMRDGIKLLPKKLWKVCPR